MQARRGRAWVVGLGAVLVVVGGGVFLSVRETDDEPVPPPEGFCNSLAARYRSSLQAIVEPEPSGPDPSVLGSALQLVFEDFVEAAASEYEDEARTVVEGVDRAAAGQLTAADVDRYAAVHEELQAAAAGACPEP